MKIGLWGFFGFGNLGDEAIQTAVIENIRTRVPSAQIVAICLDPERFGRRFGVSAYPIYSGPIFHYHENHDREERDNQASPVARQSAVDRGDREHNGSFWRRLLGGLKKLPFFKHWMNKAWVVREEARYLRTIHHFLRGLDLLVISGSGVLDDTWGGRWRRPFALYRWCLLARLARTEVVFLSIGATSLHTALGRFFAKKALQQATYRSFRDEQSRELAIQLGLPESDPVRPDLAYSLAPLRGTAAGSVPRNARKTVGIGPIPYSDPRVWPIKDPGIYRDYVWKLAGLIERLLERDWNVRFIVGEMRVDRWAIDDVIGALPFKPTRYEEALAADPISTVDELLQQIAQTDFVITSRFHGVLLPYLLAKPVLALSYDRKIENLMSAAGQKDYVLDVREFDLDTCITRFERLVSHETGIVQALTAQRNEHRQTLDNQYNLVFTQRGTDSTLSRPANEFT